MKRENSPSRRRQPGHLSAVAFLTCSVALATLSVFGQQAEVSEHTLSNGLKVLLLERHDDPSVSGGWVAHVGSANERPGITGIAHLFEHMMFKGTPTIGTKDAKRDMEIIGEQERVRDQMRAEEAKMRAAYRRGELKDLTKPEDKSERYQELEKQFSQLIQAQREVLVKNEFDRIYTTAGAAGMNAFTMQDMTGYFINVPANKIELWMWMESERLLRPVFREFYSERDVVFEDKTLGDVMFSHNNHTGLYTCVDCHTSLYNTTRSKVKVSMQEMEKGKSCGACHDGKTAFTVKEQCKSCHQILSKP